jgi:hypothetical protein
MNHPTATSRSNPSLLQCRCWLQRTIARYACNLRSLHAGTCADCQLHEKTAKQHAGHQEKLGRKRRHRRDLEVLSDLH